MTIESAILLSHGSGGRKSRQLVQELFFRYFDNSILNAGSDSALIEPVHANLAFTTDSFVVDPLFFPGGDIGKLAVCGTVNDLAVSGAIPKYLSAGFIIEEGLDIKILEEVVKSMAETAQGAGVKIITGDTKVVDRGKCDKLFINTSGIGELHPDRKPISTGTHIKSGDKILINGYIADHGVAVMSARNQLKVRADVKSDCAPLNQIIQDILKVSRKVKFIRDATRGGIATVLTEITQNREFGLFIQEELIPVRRNVEGMCGFFGFDPLYVANEGKFILIVDENDAEKLLQTMKKNPLGREAQIIGEVTDENKGRVIMQTRIGGKRIIDMLSGDQLPRIC